MSKVRSTTKSFCGGIDDSVGTTMLHFFINDHHLQKLIFLILFLFNKIFCGDARRLLKEVAFYVEEVKENEKIVESMKLDSSKDEYDVKRYEQVLAESYMMIPDSQKRLQNAIEDLDGFLTDSSELDETSEWFIQAKQILKESNNDTKQDFDVHTIVSDDINSF